MNISFQISVRELARKGAKVILTSRSVEKGNAAKRDVCDAIAPAPCDVTVMQLDLASMASVQSFANAFKATSAGGVPRLDILLLNAGVMMCPYSETADGLEMQIGTNHVGHFFLTQQLMDSLKESHARVVTVSSSSHEMGYNEGIVFDRFFSGEGYDAG
jgi:NAD(P)-dependent dehydrogenase (short-subunit alcohol dehydrogenase family)